MVALRLVRLIEKHSATLAEGLTKKIRSSGRTSDFRRLPAEELLYSAREIYMNLGDWLLTKTDSDIEVRYTHLGARRAEQGIPLSEFLWAVLLSKEHIWAFLQRESMAEGAVELFGELELMHLLGQFFDHAAYYAVVGYENVAQRKAA
jgi:hypothetical protein